MKKVKEIYYLENREERASDFSTGFVYVLEDGSKVETMTTDPVAERYTKDWTKKCTCETFQQNEDCEHIGNKVLEEVGLSHAGDSPDKCPICKGKGSYKIPVSSPIMAPYGKDNTTSVPCECKIKEKCF